MKKFLAELKPTERRWVIGLAFGAFLLINYVFIWPKFKDWGTADIRKGKAEDKLKLFRGEIAHRPEYERQIKRFETEGGGSVPAEDQLDQFVISIQNTANTYSVNIINNSPPRTSTNSPFFIQREMNFSVLAREDSLVNFLYAVGSSNSVMRVRAMSIRPDGPHQQLSATLTIEASYQKKAPTPAPAAPPAKPATTKPANQITMPGRTDKTNKTAVPVPGTASVRPGQPNAKTP